MDGEIKTQVLRKMTYGMWVVSAAAGDDLQASTVTWVSQASFAPPLVTCCVRAGTHLHEVIERAGAFALHLISADQKDLAEAFIKPTQIADGRIGGHGFTRGPATGSPLLDGFAACFEARVTDSVKRGDHTIFVAEVVDAALKDGAAAPLVLATTGWNYGG